MLLCVIKASEQQRYRVVVDELLQANVGDYHKLLVIISVHKDSQRGQPVLYVSTTL